MKYHYRPIRMTRIKKDKKDWRYEVYIGEEMKQLELSLIVTGGKAVPNLENNFAVS